MFKCLLYTLWVVLRTALVIIFAIAFSGMFIYACWKER